MGFQPKDDNRLKIHDELHGPESATQRPANRTEPARHLFVEYRDEIREALCRAVQQALLEHKRAGNPVAVSEDDQVVWIQPEQIKVYPIN